jgi:hypothetical protein
VGLDSLGRGAKLDNQRPDFIVLDDIDRDHDSELQVQKKIVTLTKKILPSGAQNLGVLAVQNLVHSESVFTRLTDGRADFLTKAIKSGPHPALEGLTYKKHGDGGVTLTSGEPTWGHLDLSRCQSIVDDVGLIAFLSEYQHDKGAHQGAFFGDIWAESIHVVKPFPIPPGWRIDRSFDWGSSRPFSVGWWAESDGAFVPELNRTFPAGTLFRIHEWYGWNGKPNTGLRILAKDIANGIRQVEKGQIWGKRVETGVADSSIFDKENGMCVANDMRNCRDNETGETFTISWVGAKKHPGSRIEGARTLHERLTASTQFPMDSPGLFIFSTCPQWIRTVPHLPKDPRNPEDIWSDAEDHAYDETRYRATFMRPTLEEIQWITH